VGDLCPESRARRPGLRLPHVGDRPLPHLVRLRRVGGRHTPDHALDVTAHPTAEWTIQQFRTAITGEAAHRFLIHDRDAIYAPAVDRAVASMGLRVLKGPCERRKPTRSASA